MDGNGVDPFDSLTQLCILSDSQEDTLRRCSFAGNPKPGDGSGSFDSQIFHLQPTAIFTAPYPETLEQREQVTPRDAYQVPPEQPGGQQPMAVDDPSLGDAPAVAGCAEVAVGGGFVRDVVMGVDLGNDTDLGFHLEVQSTQQTAEIGIIGVRRGKITESEAGGEGASASKMLKSLNEALGTTSSVPIVLEKLLIDLDSLQSGGESKLMDHNDEMAEESVTVADGQVSNGEETLRNKGTFAEKEVSEKRVENSQPEEPSNVEETTNRDQARRILPSTVNGSKDKADENPKESAASTLMEILKILAREETEEDKKLANMSILEIVSRRGMTFPRPCWWPEGRDFSFK